MRKYHEGGVMKKTKGFIFVFIVTVIGVGFLFLQGKWDQAVTKPEIPGVSAIIISQPKGGDKWFLGDKHEIHYRLVNINKPHRVRLFRGGKYLGDFAGGSDIGTHSIKLTITCGKPLLNGVKYGPGKDYQVEVATVDNKRKARTEGFFSILSPKLKKPGPFVKNSNLKLSNTQLCPDLMVKMKLITNNIGLVKLEGSIINIGKGDFAAPSLAQYWMNLRYPPKSYAQCGVSVKLAEKAFTKLKKGESIPFYFNYQIPGFGGWGSSTGMVKTMRQAKRLFSLRVLKKDGSVYKPYEECNPGNNSIKEELSYLEKHL